MNKKVIYNIGKLYTMKGGPFVKASVENIEVLENCYIVILDGKIKYIGTGKIPDNYLTDDYEKYDVAGKIVTPGLIDAHTHLVHGGSRENEFEQKLAGVPYMEILRNGGGILSTVRSTRISTFGMLYNKAWSSLDTMLGYGVTTVEAKSGYGLNLETELKQLEVAKKLNEEHVVDVVSTFMGAHATPLEYKDNTDKYIEEVVKMMGIVKARGLAEFVDVFCEEGVFSTEQTRRILTIAKQLGFKAKIHADEIVDLGGARLSAELGCVSADHLMASSVDGMRAMANANVVANILPLTSFNLNKEYANALAMIEQGCVVSLSTDYNPGSSPCENLQLAMQIGSIKLRMHPLQVLAGVTINAAKAVDRVDTIGSIEIGKKADLCVFDAGSIDYVMYHFGINHVDSVFKDGKLVVKDGQVINQ